MKGKDTAKFLLEAMKSAAFERHLAGHCEDRECTALIMYRVIPEKCVLCGLCKDACRYFAVAGGKTGLLPLGVSAL